LASPSLAILSRSPRLYSTSRLIDAARARGIDPLILHPLHCVVSLATPRPEILYRGRRLVPPAAVLPRIGASITVFGLAVLRQLEALGVVALNSSNAVASARDKLRSLQLLAQHGIAIPPTAFARRKDELRAAIDRVGGPPVVLKLIAGSQGVGVMLAESLDSAASVLDAMHWLKQDILIQAFVREAGGSDIRALVVGGRVVAAMTRQAPSGEFRANLHRGGTGSPLALSPALERTAIAAADSLGLDVAGVDLIPAAGGPLVLEVNASPGLEGIEKATGHDVAGAIIDLLLARLSASSTC
jgi:ribosomal protein S6--L-glutamate ligase